jgi:PAS domain S-box-containing protein
MPENDLRRRLQWFLLLRVGLTTGLLVATAVLYYWYDSGDTPAGGQVLAALGVTYFVSLVSGLLLTRVHNLALFAYTQLVFDTFFITGMILLTGGLHSPFAFLYHLAILNASLLLFRRGALVAASLAALCYGGTTDLLYYGVLPSAGFSPVVFLLQSPTPGLHLTMQLAITFPSFYAIALLGSYLTQRLSRVETLLAERGVALDRLSSLYQGVIQNLDTGVLITDADGRIEYANELLGELIGVALNQLTGRNVNEFFSPPQNSLSTAEPFELTLPGEGGEERTLQVLHTPLHDAAGTCVGTLYSVQDVTNARSLERGLREAEELARAAAQDETAGGESFAGLVGRSERMLAVYQLIVKVAESTTTVLITGESGTGKELVARAIHEKGSRASQPFVAVNCGAIPDTLMESELFGHVKGSFTGAVKDRSGLFRQADGGTLFLDEVGELPLPLQVKLLRVLQDHEVTPIGGNQGVRVDVRVLAATNKNLAEEVTAGRFREDLFYRLNVISITLPPLRERQGDLPLLIQHFLTHATAVSGKDVRQVSPEVMRALLDYSYPGNIRELQNLIQHAVTMAEGDTIRLPDLPFPLAERRRNSSVQPDFFRKGISLDTELEEYEQKILRAALEKVGGVQKRAAEVLGINYRSLRHRLQKYHLS